MQRLLHHSMTSFTYSGIYSNSIPIDVQNLIIDESADYLPDEVCRRRQELQQILFPSHFLQIGDRAFDLCVALTQVSFPNGLISIGEHAFHQCSSLVDVSLPDGLQKIGIRSFSQCSALKRIKVPSTVEIIENSAFSLCHTLAEVIFLEGLIKIGEYAFFECYCIREIKFPSTVETIESSAFSRCKALVDIDLPIRLKQFTYAFSDCSSLGEIDIPSSVETIGNGVFTGCTSLTDIRLREGLKRIGAASFSQATAIVKMKLPSTVTMIWDGAFSGCASLSEVDLPEGLVKIGAHALMDCVALSRIRVPSTTKIIDDFAFSGCMDLVSVEFPQIRKQALRIGDSAFRNCRSLINVAISSHMKLQCESESVDFGANAWRGCTWMNSPYGDLYTPRALEERFKKLPIHQKCYHSCDTTVDDLRLKVQATLSEDGDNPVEWKHSVDSFGMTPFHVLLSAASCRMDLLQLLLQTYPSSILNWRDVLGKRAIDHLSYIWTEETRLMMKAYLQKWLLDQMAGWGADQWRSDMADRISDISSEENKKRRDTCLRDAHFTLHRYERAEIKALLELALWKNDMVSSAVRAPVASAVADREGHKARCGASFVVPNVIDFLKPIFSE
ncbi:unnamed protein product [Cylindrotheca closterium]|uniref:Uncharacterized protein n=1 Tax=Cylindrotheca closterium TaxID=2856 RepID=A0AAD2G7K0_9STRA|nr:unnamed protein product [Cylindrotheca closterium]